VDAILELGLLNAVLVAALAIIVAGVTWLCRRPALAHALWLLVLVKLITPPLFPVEVPLPVSLHTVQETPPQSVTPVIAPIIASTPQAAAVPEQAGDAFENEEDAGLALTTPLATSPLSGGRQPPEGATDRGLPPPARPMSWQAIVAVVWLTGSCLWWCLAVWRLGRFRRLLRGASAACPEIQARAEILARRLGLSHCPGIRLLPAPLPPLLWSLLGPAFVLLPQRLWARLSSEQQDALLAHELAHYQRRDHWVRWLELAAVGLYWWHPAAWMARRALHESEELLCDARVLRVLPDAADAYAQALIQTVTFLSGPRLALPGAASGMGHVRPLKARINMIMRGTNSDRLPRAGAWALAGLGLTLMVLRPVWADGPTASTSQEQAPAVEQARKDLPAGAVRVQPVREYAASDVPITPGQPGQPAHISVAQAPGSPAPVGVRGERAPAAEGEQQELLRAQLAAKEAELHEARAMLKLAQQRLKRMSQLHRNGTLGQDELEQAQADAEVQQARVQGKEAQLREAHLRMSMLARAGRRMAGPAAAGSVGSAMAPVPVTPSAGTPAAPPGSGGPPAASNSLPAMPGMAPPGAAPNPYGRAVPSAAANPAGGRRSTEERLERLERNMEKLMKEIQRLRNELSENRSAVPGERAPESSRFRRQTDPFGGPGGQPPATRATPDTPSRP
jgi:beta-lactamase regulating signal transducer with metallopeptidase domain